MHPFDRYFYDRGSGSSSTATTNSSSSTTARNYTIDRYLDDATARWRGTRGRGARACATRRR
jgi:hypothetical protein